MKTIPLGTVVKDKVTGFEGVAENRATFMYGCDRYHVQPRVGEDGKIPEGCMVDEPQLEIMNEGVQVMKPLEEPKQLVKMGQLVEDPVKEVEGIVTGRAVYLNGCSRVMVSPKRKTIKDIEPFWVDEKQVVGKKKLLGDAKIPVTPETRGKSGGPAPSCSKY